MDDALFTTPAGLTQLAGELLPRWMPHCRWFSGKARGLAALRIAELAPLGSAWLLAVEATYSDGTVDTYAVPLAIAAGGVEDAARVATLADGSVLYDATHSASFRAALYHLLAANANLGTLRAERGTEFTTLSPGDAAPESRVLKAEQSNTALIYGDRLFVKLYRRLVPGINPDAELTRFLTERTSFRALPAFGGTVDWGAASLALALELRPNEGDAWALALREFAKDEPATRAAWLQLAHRLGQRTGEMHCALAGGDSPVEFAPEPVLASDLARVAESIRANATNLRAMLLAKLDDLPPRTGSLANEVLTLLDQPIPCPTTRLGLKTRTHGDYHLGQVLFADGDFLIIDFEGEPTRSLAERRAKQSPLRDVAGMLRSFHYAAYAGLRAAGGDDLEQAEEWARESQSAFLIGWRAATRHSPIAHADEAALLALFLREKALYEVAYELNNRPDWLHIPLRGLLT